MTPTVLYTNDFEPITVIKLSEFAVGLLKKHGVVSLGVSRRLSPDMFRCPNEPIGRPYYAIVSIRAEILRRRGREHTILFADNEESALLLKSYFLPGQRKELQGAEADSFAAGFCRALEMLVGR